MTLENLSDKFEEERRKVNTEINDERVEAHCHTSINKIEQGIKEFIKREDSLIDDDFMMRIMGRLSAGVNDLELIRDLIKQDFKYLKAERFKLAGKELLE